MVNNDPDKTKKKRGPKFTLTRSEEVAMKRECRRLNAEGARITARRIKESCAIDHLYAESVRLNLFRLGIKHRDVKQSIVLTRSHRERRVELCRKWLSSGHRWDLTVFTDEKKFNLDGPDSWSTYADEGRQLFRNKRQMGGGSVMVWAMLMPNGAIHIERLVGKIDAEKFSAMLADVVPIIDNIYGEHGFYYQQDNAPIHTARRSSRIFEGREDQLLDWPSRSPDLNIIENVWHMLSNIVYDGKQYSDVESLWTSIQEACFRLMFEKSCQLHNLYADMNKRCIEVIECKGATIKR